MVELPGTAPGSNWYHDIRLQAQSYFNLIYNATRLKNKPKMPSYVTQKKSHESATSRITASNINITPRPHYVACATRWLQKITLQLVRKHEPGIGPQLCLQSFLHLKNIRYAYRRLAECHDKVQLSKAISAPYIDSYYISISFKNLHAYVLIDS